MFRPAPAIESFRLPDGYRTAVRVWRVAQPRARVVVLHGVISHGGWYLASCAHLADAGFEVHFLERRGSGLNRQQRGDVDHYTTWIHDVEYYLDHLGDGLPRVLFGISWGGILTAAVARHRGDLVDAIGFLCAGLFSRVETNWTQRMLLRMAASVGLSSKRIAIPLQAPGLFTNSARHQEYIRTDPFRLREMTLGFARNNVRLIRYATEAPADILAPTLMMLGGRDVIVHNDAMARFLGQLGTTDQTLITYPNAAHTLEFEPDTSKYFADLREWVERIRRGSER